MDANGRVTGVEKGECVITATSVLDPSVSAECVVTVDTVNATLEGVLQDEDGNPMFFLLEYGDGEHLDRRHRSGYQPHFRYPG